MNEGKIKHLEFIQNIITRMNNNSFQIKKWSIITISAIFAISLSQKNFHILLISLVPIILFWFLDAYYLMQERKFRGLYNKVLNEEKTLKLFEMNIKPFNSKEYNYFSVLFSKTICSLYITMIITVVVLFYFI